MLVRERDERLRDRHTGDRGRDTDIHIDTRKQKHRDRHASRDREANRCRQIDRQAGRQAGRHRRTGRRTTVEFRQA